LGPPSQGRPTPFAKLDSFKLPSLPAAPERPGRHLELRGELGCRQKLPVCARHGLARDCRERDDGLAVRPPQPVVALVEPGLELLETLKKAQLGTP
jgi:hypothetical protein